MRGQFGIGGVRCARVIAVVILGVFSFSPILAQSPTSRQSPREVLEAYRKMDAEGERLTAGGWYRASKFFVKPARPPSHYFIAVMDGERITNPNPWFKGGNNRAEIDVVCEALGQIDSSGSFTSVVGPSSIDPSGRPVRKLASPFMRGPAPLGRSYDLVLTDTHWEFGPNREGLREVKGPPEWRIETFEFEPWVTIDVAIRYLTRLRDESGSEIIKGNADKSIATLSRLKVTPRVQTTK